ncbi:hypothetical protein HPP92_004846 [Vanilla planifolia]|uniref:Uncharacterized protein n=1 Tax=Vanilla planifolia TaxID=51239 RepID=A0A835RSN4_VANPL|nr:hypothetical protein HPP92_004846 [Vanilla planifolia]
MLVQAGQRSPNSAVSPNFLGFRAAPEDVLQGLVFLAALLAGGRIAKPTTSQPHRRRKVITGKPPHEYADPGSDPELPDATKFLQGLAAISSLPSIADDARVNLVAGRPGLLREGEKQYVM